MRGMCGRAASSLAAGRSAIERGPRRCAARQYQLAVLDWRRLACNSGLANVARLRTDPWAVAALGLVPDEAT